jgi:hypothetical protein
MGGRSGVVAWGCDVVCGGWAREARPGEELSWSVWRACWDRAPLEVVAVFVVPPLEVCAAYCVAVAAGLPSLAGWMFVGAALGADVGC